MAEALVWISGASRGIGAALAAAVPWEGARVLDISRRGSQGLEHVEGDLSDPASWHSVAQSFERELADFSGDRVVFLHAAGTLQPLGFAGEVDTDSYITNVVLNSAAPQVLGHAFLAAAKDVDARRHIVMVTSGAASSPSAGWSSYGAGKAAIDQWVRTVGVEQDQRGGVQVISVNPGMVDTGMQAQIRETSEEDFPKRDKYIEAHEKGQLGDPDEVAREMWSLLDRDFDNGAVIDLKELAAAS